MFGFGKKKGVKEQKPMRPKKIEKKTQSKNKDLGKKPKASQNKHWLIKTVIIVLLLTVFSYGMYNYIETVKENAYVQGGNDAIDIVTKTVKENGGVEIEYNGEAITLSAYYKPIGSALTETETTETNETNSSA